MSMRLLPALAVALAMGLATPVLAQNQPAADAAKPEAKPAEPPQPVVVKNGDWFVGCQEITVDGKVEKACEMQQVLEDSKSGQALIRISIAYPRNSDKPVLRVMTPLGVLLNQGLGLQINDGKTIRLPFAICIGKPQACIVEGTMEKDIVDAMRRGKTGKLTIAFGNKQTLDAPFSLNGFTKSLTSLRGD
jgi:invasion protein IalB